MTTPTTGLPSTHPGDRGLQEAPPSPARVLNASTIPSKDRGATGPDAIAGLNLRQLRRFQWAVRATLVLGVAASVCANILHARDSLIAQTIAAWPPLALMLTVELISRVPVYRRALALLRILATTSIAGIAAYVSYFHMAAVVARYGEHQPNPYMLPISVDGLIVVASVSLLEIAGRIRTIRHYDATGGHTGPPVSDAASHDDQRVASAESRAGLASNNHHSAALPTTALPPSPHGTQSFPSRTAQARPSSPSGPDPSSSPRAEKQQAANGTRTSEIDADLTALLPAARTARDTLHRDGRTLTRDSLAAQLRHDGHTIRTSRASALLNLIKREKTATGHSPSVQSPITPRAR